MQALGGTDPRLLGGVLRLGVKDKEGTQDSCGHDSFSRSWLSWLLVSCQGWGPLILGHGSGFLTSKDKASGNGLSQLCPSYQMEETNKASML